MPQLARHGNPLPPHRIGVKSKERPLYLYVTPQQAHQGLRQKIVEQRRIKKLAQRRRRRAENQKQKTGKTKTNKPITMTASLVV